MIPYGIQNISEADIQAVVEVLRSDFLTQGPAIERFELTVADYCGVRYAVALSSATAGLHLACMAVGLGPGDFLWTSPNTFVASANCGRYCGATVDFVDIDPHTYNLHVPSLRQKLVQAQAEGRLPKVLIPVHFAGQSCPMAEIAALADEYGFTIIEDAAHAIGGRYRGEPIGNCRHSAMTVFSFHPVKIITTGEGGVVTTNDEALYERLVRLRSHGVTRDPAKMGVSNPAPWEYAQLELGYNFRMTDLQAALGVSQMTRLDAFVQRRRELADRYDEKLAGLPVVTPTRHPEAESAWHLYVIRLQTERLARSRREIFEDLRRAGIGVNVHYIPVHTQAYYRELGFRRGDFPEAEAYYEQAITLPLYFDLSLEQQDFIIDTLKRVLV